MATKRHEGLLAALFGSSQGADMARDDSLRTPKKWWFLPLVGGVFKEGLGIYVLYVSIYIYIYHDISNYM